ncbi:MAG: hypothetical protein EAZ82_12240 [Verrucomicrobia bacterium]|nr:MAG: hypothetical protein EAZ82_12240 [Verrucomicrobiota bacterium]
MIFLLNNHIGRVHHAIQHPALSKTRPAYAFIPEAHFGPDGFQKSRYLVSRWPSVNCSANPLAVGSHIIPDPQKPVNPRNRCPVLREFLARLEIVAGVKNPSVA